MHRRMFEKFLEPYFTLHNPKMDGEFIQEGQLLPRGGGAPLPITNYILRLTADGYCDSFKFQWDNFRSLQHDSSSGIDLSTSRVWNCTHWTKDELAGKNVIELGCGPGRFSEVFLQAGADLVAVDMSTAVDVNLENTGLRDNLLLIQADITTLTWFEGKFDFVFCYGVLQHTPNPVATFHSISQLLGKNGKISIDVYRKFRGLSPWATPKYLWRPLTKHIPCATLLKILRWYIPKYIDFDTFIRGKRYGNLWVSLMPIPCWNYLPAEHPRDERIEHAILATFDALSPAYDIPMNKKETTDMFAQTQILGDIQIEYGANGIVGNAVRVS